VDTLASLKIKKMSPQFLVTDLNRSLEFYTNKLGFDIAFIYEDFYAGIIKADYSIHLKLGKPSPEERRNKKENLDLDIVFSVKNVEDLYNDLQKESIEFIQPLCIRPYGKEFYISDPDGYILAFLEET
jgi:catechol 2,3-dioxygenase-like lactoylglutathione lyase family enzyme